MPPGRSDAAAAIAPVVATPFYPRRQRVRAMATETARRRGTGQTRRASIMTTKMTPRAASSPIPTPPRRVMSLLQPLSLPLLVDVHVATRAVRLGMRDCGSDRVALVVSDAIVVLGIRVDHRRRFARRAARKFKFHVEGVLARGRRAEKPPLARALPRPKFAEPAEAMM